MTDNIHKAAGAAEARFNLIIEAVEKDRLDEDEVREEVKALAESGKGAITSYYED